MFSKTFLIAAENFNFSLDVHYVPSNKNPAEFPSRKVSDMEFMLSESVFGSRSSVSLGPTPSTSCRWIAIVNTTASVFPTLRLVQLQILTESTFLQSLPSDHNLYVFPPFVLIAPLLKCMLEQDFHGAFTIIIRDLKPRRFWWALLQSLAVDRVLLGRKNEDGVMLFPSQDSQHWSSRKLQRDLWAIRCVC